MAELLDRYPRRSVRRYRDTPMAGRTHLQQALPITFGYKTAIVSGFRKPQYDALETVLMPGR